MASLRQIRRRIKTAKNIQQITKAMKVVSASRLRRAQQRMLSGRPYAELIEQVIREAADGAAALHPLLAPRPGAVDGKGPLVVVVVAADKGLCGGFNVNIIRRALQIVRENRNVRPVKLVLVGRKPRDFFRRLNLPTAGEYINFFNRLSFADADVIASDLMKAYLAGEADEVLLLYTQFRSVVTLKVTEQRLLPLADVKASASTPGGATAGREYAYEPGAQAILGAMLPRAVKAQVWRALLESAASELAARMTAMDNATRNSSEMIGSLTLFANRIRQAQITKEIAEIVGGAEALK